MILKEAVSAVLDRRNQYETARDYYEGNTIERFTSDALARVFRTSHLRGRLNFCRPVVDAVFNRLEISTVTGVSDEANQVLGQVWEDNELDLEADEFHRWSEVYGDYFAFVWPDETGEKMEIFGNSPLTAAIVYDPEHPTKKKYGVKMWVVQEGNATVTRLNLYYADRVEKYRTQGDTPSEGAQWSLIDTEDNPFGVVPVFHFRTERPFGRPEHIDAYDAQDYINKQFVTSQVVTDFQAAKQRWAITRSDAQGGNEAQDFDDDEAAQNNNSLKNGAGNLWILEGIEKVGEFSAAEPGVFWDPIKDTIRAMASLTNTPLHYFEKTGNVPSGEALRVAEAPLIKKVDRRKQSFGSTWREIFRFILNAYGVEEDVQVKWIEVESLDALERLDAALKKSTLGMSFEQIARELGYDEEVIALMMEQKAAERAAGQVSKYPNGEEVSNDQTNAMEVEE